MSSKDSKQLAGAPIIMKARGQQTDLDIYDYVRGNTGCTVRDISETLEMSRGRVDGSVNRLVESGLVDVRYFRRNNILIKRIEPVGLQKRPFDQVMFPSSLLDASLWKEKAYACAVSRSAIKIVPELKEEWRDQCAFTNELFFQKLDGNYCFKFTDDFIKFYEMPNSELDVSGFKDEILVTVDSTLIPVDAPYDS